MGSAQKLPICIFIIGTVMKTIGIRVAEMMKYLTAIMLATMAILVFGNVLMRYFLNSSVTWAEEVSRFVFIWMIFLGAIIAFKDNEHLGVDTIVSRLSLRGRRRLFVVNSLIILATMALTLHGSIGLRILNTDQSSPAIGLPYAYIYSSGIVISIGIGLIAIYRIVMLITGRLNDEDLVMTTDSEENSGQIESMARDGAAVVASINTNHCVKDRR